MEDHTHGPDGHVVISEPSPELAETEAIEEAAHAEVEIARIEADRDVAVAKIAAKTEEAHDETEVEALRAEIRGMKEILGRLSGAGESEPDTVPDEPIVVVHDVDATPDVPAPPENREEHHEPRKSRGLGLW